MTFFLVIDATLTSNFNLAKYKEQLKSFCSSVIKSVCTKENINLGMHIFATRFIEIQEEANRKRKLLKKVEKLRLMQKIKEERLIQILRERFLDRHL